MTPRSLVWLMAAALLVTVPLTACRPTEPPDPAPPSPTTSAPAPVLRYDPIDDSYCGELQLPEVFADLGLTFDPERATEYHDSQASPGPHGPSLTTLASASCHFGSPVEDVPVPHYGNIIARVKRDPGETRRFYEPTARQAAVRESGELGEGWWAEARFYELHERRPFVAYHAYHAYHENLLVEAWVEWDGYDDPEDVAETRTIFHELLAALLGQSIQPVPLAHR